MLGSTTGNPFAGVTIADINLNNPVDTLTITLSDANATLAVGASHPAGVTFTGGNGSYTLTGSAADITSELDALTLTVPSTLTGAVDGVETLTFSLSDASSAYTPAPTTATLTANLVAAPPTITGGSTIDVFAGSTTGNPFAGVTIADINPNNPVHTLTITLSDATATLAVGASHPAGVTFTGGSGSYTLTGSAADITSELDALTLTVPSTLTGAVDGVETLIFSLSATTSVYPLPPTTATLTDGIFAPIFSKTFDETGAIQTFTVQTSGYYDIAADGAQGGVGGFGHSAGGLGAFASGDVYLQAGAQLEIVVGGVGGDNGSGVGGGGGGGGSFVIETNNGLGAVNVNEVIAGGGGGGSYGRGGGGGTQGTGGPGFGNYGGGGGGGGVDGAAGLRGNSYFNGGGGGGGFTGGAAGQNGNINGVTFGGGGGGSLYRGGGGGGFGGGGGGASGGGGGGGFGGGGGGGNGPAGGGGSFVSGSALGVAKVAQTHGGNGQVTITAVTAPTITIASPSAHATSAGAPVDPFTGDVIGDPNVGSPTETLTVTLSAAANGVLNDPDAGTDGSSYDPVTGVYSISGTANDVTSALQLLAFDPTAGVYGDTTFTISDLSSAYPLAVSDASTTVSDTPCYCRGTLIATARGEVAVEALTIGDRVATRSGALRPIKWIGRRSYGGRFILGRTDILPVCIKAGALDDSVPRRDLWISPHHAMYFKDMYFKDKNLEGVLIEARDLVNGVSIVQAERVEKVEYFHIELDSHDVIVAEGSLSESFIDDDSRGMFHNAHDYDTLYSDMPSKPAQYCAPRCDDGYELETVRRKLALRAGAFGQRRHRHAARLYRCGRRERHRGLGAECRASGSAGLPRHLCRRPADRTDSRQSFSRGPQRRRHRARVSRLRVHVGARSFGTPDRGAALA